MARSAWWAILFVAATVGCAPRVPSVTTYPFETPPPGGMLIRDRPPDLVVAAGDEQLTLAAISYCWSTENGEQRQVVCADGAIPDSLPSVRLVDGADLAVVFPLPWDIQAQFLPNGGYCDGALLVDADPSG